MELKPDPEVRAWLRRQSFNRTFMELKLAYELNKYLRIRF